MGAAAGAAELRSLGAAGCRVQVTVVSARCQGCGEAEDLEREPVGVAVVAAQLRGDVRDLVQVQDADNGVADGGLGLVRG